MNTLALDLGTHTGWCLNNSGSLLAGTWHLATPKQIKIQRQLRGDRRLDFRVENLWNYLNHAHKLHGLNWLVWEDVLFQSSRMQSQLWASFRTVCWLFASQNGIKTECCNTATLKKFATGNGAADKNQMRAAASQHSLYRQLSPLDENAVDALLLMLWATKTIQG